MRAAAAKHTKREETMLTCREVRSATATVAGERRAPFVEVYAGVYMSIDPGAAVPRILSTRADSSLPPTERERESHTESASTYTYIEVRLCAWKDARENAAEKQLSDRDQIYVYKLTASLMVHHSVFRVYRISSPRDCVLAPRLC